MRHFLFEGDYEGEELLIGADSVKEAKDRALELFDVHFEMSDYEAETWGLDEY